MAAQAKVGSQAISLIPARVEVEAKVEVKVEVENRVGWAIRAEYWAWSAIAAYARMYRSNHSPSKSNPALRR